MLLVGAVARDPVSEGRPGADHHLVGEVDARIVFVVVVIDGEQAIGDHRLQDHVELAGVVGDRAQLGARLLAPGVGPALAEADEAKQDPARDRDLLR